MFVKLPLLRKLGTPGKKSMGADSPVGSRSFMLQKLEDG